MSLWSIRIVTRFCNSSSTQVPRFLSSRFLLLRSDPVRNNLLPTTRVSRLHASISRCYHSVCIDSQSESRHTELSAIDTALDSVVKIFCFRSDTDVDKPWKNSWEGFATGTGFVIFGRRVLTNAHIVKDHTDLQVKKHGSPTKYEAIVEAVGDECDLAILAVDNEEFWEDSNPLELGDIPYMGDTVYALGYPRGGDTISVTKGIVSSVTVNPYCHSSTELLTIQVDAAITYGNSGGPVIMGNKVAGVAFQGRVLGKNTVYLIIPTPVVNHFLSVVEEKGYYTGFDLPDISCQAMENSNIRKHFKMTHGMSGVLINEMNMVSAAHKFLKKDDVILAIDGVPIGNDATIVLRGKERINFNHLVSMKKPGEKGLFKVLRDGREHEFKISLNSVQPRLVPVRQYDPFDPRCYIFAGFIFASLSKPKIDNSSDAICDCALKRRPEKAAQEIIIISEMLEDDINVGYYSFKKLQVKKVNGEELLNLDHLRRRIEKCRTEVLRLDLEKGKVIILHYKSACEENLLILKRHRIPSSMS
ncbi:PREDICTED: putative protease Do-like 3, mitochondrial [Camelina sativa]|uniref:Protease Do-like 3, mitochondrial n=1 Tax=Camelina sativa TaxID=90675 RepID=A0ABM0UTJ4_CAMSA|nr:PREDICTED: putative protease Do-like 3, mitochondrial [Camelina sativa]